MLRVRPARERFPQTGRKTPQETTRKNAQEKTHQARNPPSACRHPPLFRAATLNRISHSLWGNRQLIINVILNETKWSEESLFILNILREILRFAQNDIHRNVSNIFTDSYFYRPYIPFSKNILSWLTKVYFLSYSIHIFGLKNDGRFGIKGVFRCQKKRIFLSSKPLIQMYQAIRSQEFFVIRVIRDSHLFLAPTRIAARKSRRRQEIILSC